jgi:hypothetical protein
MDDGWRKVVAGACGAWPLPADATCAGLARRLFRRTASALAVDAEVIDDGETIVSELAANTLHVTSCGVHGSGDIAGISLPATSELWLYLRGSGQQCELVCKVFDTCTGWAHGGAPGKGGRRAAADAPSGRGLEVVHELSGGIWGHHLTRSRLGGWNVPGKAVWFTAAAPLARRAPSAIGGVMPRTPPENSGAFAIGGLPCMTAAQATARLEEKLVARGFVDAMVRADDPARDTSVLSACGELTVWCRAGCAWLRAPGMDGTAWDGSAWDGSAWSYGDLVEVEEQVVEAHETFCADRHLTGETARGACLSGG